MNAFTTHKPITYCIAYGGPNGYLDSPDEILPSLKASPPHLMHLGHDVPFPNSFGPVRLVDGKTILLTPSEVKSRIEDIRRFLKSLREAGCTTLICYVCNQTIAGCPDKRLGIWEFYDHWEEYADLDVEPRPSKDPSEWLAREPNGRPHFNYEKRHAAFLPYDMQRWAPCCNNPYYNQFQCLVVKHIARVGYDGVFVDNNNLNCYCPHCERKFQKYLAKQFSSHQLRELFGVRSAQELSLARTGSRLLWVKRDPVFKEYLRENRSAEDLIRWFGSADPDAVALEEAGNGWLWGRAHDYARWLKARFSPDKIEQLTGLRDISQWGLNTPAERLLWAETKRFWAESVRENLHLLRETGQSERSGFLVSPNWGNMEEPDAAEFREEIGHSAAIWAPSNDFTMFEEGNAAGAIAPGLYLDHILQYKYSLAAGVAPAVLPYGNLHPGLVDLGYAENVAQGGVAYIQPGVDFPEIRAKWRAFIDQHGTLLAGARPWAEVAVLYSFDELVLEHHRHETWVRRIIRYLSDQHILFNMLTLQNILEGSLDSYGALIVPAVRYLSDDHAKAIHAFVKRGGTLVVVGECGTHDAWARPRERGGLEGRVKVIVGDFPDVRVSEDSRIIAADAPDPLIGKYRLSREEALQFATYSQGSLNVPFGSAGIVFELDRMVGVDRYQPPCALAPLLERAMGHALRLADAYDAIGVSFNAFRQRDARFLLHIVNYNVPAVPHRRDKTVEAVSDLVVAMPLGPCANVSRATVLEPGRADETIQVVGTPGGVSFTISGLDVYKLVVLEV